MHVWCYYTVNPCKKVLEVVLGHNIIKTIAFDNNYDY